MNCFSNIEIINFDNFHNSEQDQFLKEMLHEAGSFLPNYAEDRYEKDVENMMDNLNIDNFSNCSFYSEMQCQSQFESSSAQLTEPTTQSISPLRKILTVKDFSFSHERQFCCPFSNCNKAFKFKWILERHLISHKNLKQFKCSEDSCTKAYKSKENLTLHHRNIHLKEKPYNCRYCEAVFSHRNGKDFN
jgi:hypothetical protein